jgi:hypothetical protein
MMRVALACVVLGIGLMGCGPSVDILTDDPPLEEPHVAPEDTGTVAPLATCTPGGFIQYTWETKCDYGSGVADIGCFCNPSNPYEMSVFCGRYINQEKARQCYRSATCTTSCGAWYYTGKVTYTYKTCADYGCR